MTGEKGKHKFPTSNDINQMSNDEIREQLKQYKRALMSDAAKNRKGLQLDNPMSIRQTKKTIARMMTILIKRNEKCV